MLRRLAVLAVLVLAAGLTAVIASAPAQALGVTSSNITSPVSGTHYFITDSHPAKTVTVTGTSNGTTGDTVDIRCYANAFRWQGGPNNIPVAPDGTFSTSMTTDTPYGTCVLRAVPSGLAGGSNVRSYTGPKLTTEWAITKKISSGLNAGKIYDFYAEYQSAQAMNDYCSTSCGGLWDSRLSYSDGSSSSYLWYANGFLANVDPTGNRAGLQVDGRNAYLPRGAVQLFAANSGVRAMSFSASRNASTGDTTIRTLEPAVVCPGTAFPPTPLSCGHFNTAGVQLERTIVATDGGRQVHISDVWRSTDHKAHTISAHFGQSIEGRDQAPPGTSTPVGIKLPWLSGGYKTFNSDVTYAGTSRAPNTIFVRDDTTAPDGSLDWPRGALSSDVPLSSVRRTSDGFFTLLDANVRVPAGGTRLVREYFVMGTSDSQVAAKAAANRNQINPYRPDGLVKTKSASRYVGNHVYNTTGSRQTVTAKVKRSSAVTFDIEVQNDGTATDSFKLKGPGNPSGFSVKYLAGASGSTNITSAIEHGTYRMSNLAPGQARVIRLVVTVKSGASVGAARAWLIRATSALDGTRKDAVKAVVKVVAG